MTSLRRLATRGTLLFLAPLVIFACSDAGSTGDEGDDDDSGDCRKDVDCPEGRICVGLDGNRDDACDVGESCGCIVIGTGGDGGAAGDTNGGSAGDSNGGSSTGGNATGGSGKGGSANGGSSTGGNGTGGAMGGSGGAMGGSGGAMGGSGGMQSDCETYCDRFIAAMCVTSTHAACVTNCEGLIMECPAEGPAYAACIADDANPITCMNQTTTIAGCNAPIDALSRCIVCLPDAMDEACIACTRMSCCEELADYTTAPDGASFDACVDACTTQTCVEACAVSNPVAGSALAALFACQDVGCPEPCICAPSPTDDACLGCIKTSCCADYADYVLAADSFEFEACAGACTTTQCIDGCVASFPLAGAAYNAVNACIDSSCLTECTI